MKTRLALLLVMLCLVLTSLVVSPSEVRACSGDECGCASICDGCDSEINPPACYSACRPAVLQCSIACCRDW